MKMKAKMIEMKPKFIHENALIVIKTSHCLPVPQREVDGHLCVEMAAPTRYISQRTNRPADST